MVNALYSVGTLNDDNGTTIVRFREGISLETQREFPNQFVVEWQFSGPLQSGLPFADELEESEEVGAGLAEVLEGEGASVLALVCTGNGYREWYFYCKDVTYMQNLLNTHFQGRTYPIKLNVGIDTDWGVYWQFVGPFIRKMAN